MIVLNLELDNIYSFKDFKVNFSYPKRVIKSTIEGEYLKERPNFRYRKAVILMGSNGSGKTTLGRALLRIFRFIELGDFSFIREMIGNPSKPASFSIDFVNGDNVLNRLVFESRKEDEKSLLNIIDDLQKEKNKWVEKYNDLGQDFDQLKAENEELKHEVELMMYCESCKIDEYKQTLTEIKDMCSEINCESLMQNYWCGNTDFKMGCCEKLFKKQILQKISEVENE